MTAPQLSAALHMRARSLDDADVLASFRARFLFPHKRDGTPVVYLAGNSLGLQPTSTRAAVLRELDAWATYGVEGHFTPRDAQRGPAEPWFSYHELVRESGARLVGARPGEVVAMGSLTANLHALMVSFYRPSAQRRRVVIEKGAFPSDRFAVQTQAHMHGLRAEDTVVELAPRAGEDLLRTDDVLAFIEREGDDVALFLMGGVNFYSGQAYDIRAITRAARAKGITVGWDLAHAAGNLALSLHDDDVDFAAWCTYKYLNAGPGAVAMAFVHERHARAFDLPRMGGWWGHDPNTRFQSNLRYAPQEGAAGWQVSNAPILSLAALHASLALFDEATIPALRTKSVALTGLLQDVVDAVADARAGRVKLVTPRDANARGAQLSLRVQDPQALAKRLHESGVVVDERKPDVIRAAPTPLYNSFADVVAFGEALLACLPAGEST